MALDSRVLTTLIPLLTQETSGAKAVWRERLGFYQARFRQWEVAVKRDADIVTVVMRDRNGQALGQEDFDDDRARALHDAILAQSEDAGTISITQFVSEQRLDRAFLPVTWQETNVTAGQATGVALDIVGLSLQQFPLPRDGSLMSLGVLLSSTITAGLLRLELTRDGTDTGRTVDITSGYKQIWELEAGQLSFTKGQELGIKWGSSGTLAPTPFELNVFFEAQWLV